MRARYRLIKIPYRALNLCSCNHREAFGSVPFLPCSQQPPIQSQPAAEEKFFLYRHNFGIVL